MGYGKNTTNYSTHTHKHETNVVEHRAPTDDSIRLLREFEEKAKENIIKVINIDSNNLKCIAILYLNEPMTHEVALHCKFSLNNKEYVTKSILEYRYSTVVSFDKNEVIREIISKMSNVIAIELLKSNPDVLKFL